MPFGGFPPDDDVAELHGYALARVELAGRALGDVA